LGRACLAAPCGRMKTSASQPFFPRFPGFWYQGRSLRRPSVAVSYVGGGGGARRARGGRARRAFGARVPPGMRADQSRPRRPWFAGGPSPFRLRSSSCCSINCAARSNCLILPNRTNHRANCWAFPGVATIWSKSSGAPTASTSRRLSTRSSGQKTVRCRGEPGPRPHVHLSVSTPGTFLRRKYAGSPICPVRIWVRMADCAL